MNANGKSATLTLSIRIEDVSPAEVEREMSVILEEIAFILHSILGVDVNDISIEPLEES